MKKEERRKKNNATERPVIYQVLPRLFTNYTPNPVPNGTIMTNGSGKLNDINDDILKAISDLGCTHVWYTGVIEHGHDADYTRYGIARHNPHVIKGRAGSPYAITDYYDIDPDLAVDVPNRMAEYEALIERTHRAGLKVVMDFVPNHVGREYHSDAAPAGVPDFGTGDNTDWFFSPTNDFYYIPRQQFSPSIDLGHGEDAYVEFPARATGNDCYTAYPSRNDWYETVKLNYGVDPANGSKHFDPVPPVWLKMLAIMRFWAEKGIDALRCDMVHMVPVEFWHWAIPQVKEINPDLKFIAEIYDVALYRPYIEYGGFDYLYDKVTLYDTLRGIQCHNTSAARLTSCWQTVDGISDKMLSFLENHDEQRYASPQFVGDASRVLPALVVTATFNRGAVMVYMGQEIGEPGLDAEGFSGKDGRTTIFDYWSLDTLRRRLNHGKPTVNNLTVDEQKLLATYSTVLKLVNKEAALREGAFYDLMYVNYENPGFNPHRHFAYLRSTATETVLCVVNFDDVDADISVNIPEHAFEFLGLNQGTAMATELLTGRRRKYTVNAQEPFTTHVKANGATLWKIRNASLADVTKIS